MRPTRRADGARARDDRTGAVASGSVGLGDQGRCIRTWSLQLPGLFAPGWLDGSQHEGPTGNLRPLGKAVIFRGVETRLACNDVR